MWLFLAFLAVPLIEIALFVQIGGAIGLGWTLAIVIFTAILGTWLVRTQGFMALGQLKGSISQMQDPTEPLANGAMILFSGALLLTPGFFTDGIGFALLMPPVRAAIIRFFKSRITIHNLNSEARPADKWRNTTSQGDIIDGDFQDITPSQPSNDPNPPRGLSKD